MAKKKKNNTQEKLFDKSADILTDNNGQYHIRKNRVYICGSDYYGKVYTITSNKYNRNNVHIIKELYPSDNKRIRFLMVNYKNAKKFKTIEKLSDGTERRINVIESFSDASEYICSIGDIKHFKSDLIEENNLQMSKSNLDLFKTKILKLIKKDDKEESNKKRVS